ncbi:MAG: molybdopterin-dependent oxidoreductase [bacterium]|nr:molybdopterin-dependent oxidoreductase [bacterium]
MRERKVTYCRICEGLCGLIAEVEDGRLVNLSPDPEHPVSRGYFCPKGKAMLHLQNDPERVRTPLKRTASGWEKISWDQAIGEISEKLSAIRKNHGSRAIGMYMGNPAAFSYSQAAFVQGFIQGIGTPNFFSAGSQDCNNKFAFSQIFYGSPLIHLFPDIDHSDYLMIIGSNPLVSHMSFITVPRVAERIKAIEKRGGKLVIIDPRRTETSRVAGEHIFIRPDSDIYFLLSVIRQILKENLEDQTYLKTYTEGLETLREICEPYTPEKAAGLTGIPAETIIRIAHDFSSARTAACYGRLGACLGRFGTMVSWGIEVLNLVTGNLDRPGGAIFHSGHIDLIRSFELSGMGRSKERSRIGNHPHLMGSFPAGIMADEILTPGQGQIRAMLVDSGNPIVSCPNTRRLEEAFSKLELLVMVDHYRNETARFAHYILPAATFLERDDMPVANTGFQPIPYAQYTEAVVPPDGDQLPQWDIYTRLTERMNLPLMGVIPSRLVFKPARFMEKLPLVGPRLKFKPSWLIPGLLLTGGRQVTFRKLKKAPHGVLLKPFKSGDLLEKRFRKKGKKLNLVPPEFIAELRKVAGYSDPKPDPEYPFLLIGRRRLGQINSWMQGAPRLKGVANDCLVHPEDASRLNLAEGDMVRVTSRVGSVEIIVKVTDEIMPGVVSIPHGYHDSQPEECNFPGKVPGANANILTDENDLETFAGMALLNGVHVRVEKISKHS